jgi:hypothetical protein
LKAPVFATGIRFGRALFQDEYASVLGGLASVLAVRRSNPAGDRSDDIERGALSQGHRRSETMLVKPENKGKYKGLDCAIRRASSLIGFVRNQFRTCLRCTE